MKLVMTLQVRDEADILEANLDYHLANGVDHVVITDNRSTDATGEIARRYERRGVATVIDEPGDIHDQSAWVTRMACLAATELDADWVINNDADEFWLPQSGDLKSVFSAVAADVGALQVARTNFLPVRDLRGPFWRDMVWRERDSRNGLGEPLQGKVAHRARADIVVAHGNHGAEAPGLGRLERSEELIVFHFPHRTRERYLRKIAVGGRAVLNNPNLSPETFHVWRRHLDLHEHGALSDWFDRLPHADDPETQARVASGEVMLDKRLSRFMQALGERSGA